MLRNNYACRFHFKRNLERRFFVLVNCRKCFGIVRNCLCKCLFVVGRAVGLCINHKRNIKVIFGYNSGISTAAFYLLIYFFRLKVILLNILHGGESSSFLFSNIPVDGSKTYSGL